MTLIKLLLILILVVTPALADYVEITEGSLMKEGTQFEGSTLIEFHVLADNTVEGTVTYKFIEQGWTIKLHSAICGNYDLKSKQLDMRSTTTTKYAGKDYDLIMQVKATYDPITDTYSGVKTGSIPQANILKDKLFRAILQ
jgi:hypothetical protein